MKKEERKKYKYILLIVILILLSGSIIIFKVNDRTSIEKTGNKQEQKQEKEVINDYKDDTQSVIFECSNIEFPEDIGDGFPIIYNMFTNYTENSIVGYQYGMLAFDEEGNPLEIYWIGIDSSVEKSYYHLYKVDGETILPNQTTEPSGWSLLSLRGREEDERYFEIEYVLCCFKEIKFDNGDKWINSKYDEWRDLFMGKKIDVDLLKAYYPYVYVK